MNTDNWRKISLNKNLTLKIILDNLDKLKELPEGLTWDWDNLCVNVFETDCKNYVKNQEKKLLLTKILECKKNNNNCS